MPGLAKCRQCGDEIYWFQSRSGRSAPPMTPTTENVNVVIDGILHTFKRWNRHVCDPAKRERLEQSEQRRVRQEEEARAQRREAEEAREQRRLLHLHEAQIYEVSKDAREALATERYRLAMLHVCPECEAEVGEPCENLSFARRGQTKYTKNPHLERFELVPEADRPFWLSTTEFVAPALSGGRP